MPARSNLFQDVVGIIERHRAGGTVVTESAMFIDPDTGGGREVDVTVTGLVDGDEVVLSIEAADRNRRADVTWVEQLHTKHSVLPTTQLVLVAAAGFYEPARLKAAALGITTVTPEDLEDDDHEFAVIARLAQPPVSIKPTLAGITMEVHPPAGAQMVETDGAPRIYGRDGTLVPGGAEAIGESLIDRHLADLLTEICKDLSVAGRRKLTLRGLPTEPLFGEARMPDGRVERVAVESVVVDVEVDVRFHPGSTMVARLFDQTPTLYGGMQLGDAQATFVATDHEGTPRATLRTREPGQSAPEDWTYDGALDIPAPPADETNEAP